MQHDPELVAETRSWLVKASKDLGAAAHEFKAEPPFLADIVFHAQQAAEKSFKSFLTWHSVPFRKTLRPQSMTGRNAPAPAAWKNGK